MARTYATRHSHVRRLDSVVVIKPHGDLIGGPETDDLEALIDQFDTEGVSCLVINLAAISPSAARASICATWSSASRTSSWSPSCRC